RRGGVLTSAALLTLTSDPGRTNIPRRGTFVSGTILGTPPPPPPPDVPELEESADDGNPRPLREVFEEHSRNPACASCHAKIDPIGFALQNFDAIGRWRDTDAGQPIDSSGELPSGQKLDGVESLKRLLMEKQDQISRSMTENLIVFALGRGLQTQDECVVREALANLKARGQRFSAVVEAIVLSVPFRYRSDAAW
ncbi:MAG: DUF1588 domain-containing protein, partial [Planctomycetota bacterium]